MTLSQLTQAMGLLKFFDRAKVNPSAVQEIGKLANLSIDEELAARIAAAYKTRGQVGLLPFLPQILELAKDRSETEPAEKVFVCQRCGHASLVR